MTKLVDQFINEGIKISYREWSERGGNVVAWFKNGWWFYRHETESDSNARSEAMTTARARYIFPTDAVAA